MADGVKQAPRSVGHSVTGGAVRQQKGMLYLHLHDIVVGGNHLVVGKARLVPGVDHRIDSVARGVLPGHEAGAGRGAIGSARVGLAEDDSLFC